MDAAATRRRKLMEMFGWSDEEHDAVMGAKVRTPCAPTTCRALMLPASGCGFGLAKRLEERSPYTNGDSTLAVNGIAADFEGESAGSGARAQRQEEHGASDSRDQGSCDGEDRVEHGCG